MNLFENKLAEFISDEVHAYQSDPSRLSIIIEQISYVLGMTIAIASEGNPERIDGMITACENYAHDTAVTHGNAIRNPPKQSS